MRGKRTALVEGIAVAPAAARLAELYVRFARSATQLAYLLTGDRASAEDLVQDSFVRISSRLAPAQGGCVRDLSTQDGSHPM
jgi:DNA-directed RNA polymerase specialized sigma24 family protein